MGIAVGSSYLHRTFDGGENWERLDSFGPDHWNNRIDLIDVDLIDSSYGWVTGYYYDSALNPIAAFVSITSDRGKTWEHHEFPTLTEGISISVLAESIGISVLSQSRGLLIGGSPGSVWRYDMSSDVPSERATRVRELDLRP